MSYHYRNSVRIAIIQTWYSGTVAFRSKNRIYGLCTRLSFHYHEHFMVFYWRYLDYAHPRFFRNSAWNHHHWNSLGQAAFQNGLTGADTVWEKSGVKERVSSKFRVQSQMSAEISNIEYSITNFQPVSSIQQQ